MIQENGDPVELVVTRNTSTDHDLVVTIVNGGPTKTNPPIIVIIPAGETSATFEVNPVNDLDVDGDQTSPITATAPAVTPYTQEVPVEDDDVGYAPPGDMDDNPHVDYLDVVPSFNGVAIGLSNALDNDTDAENDPLTVVSLVLIKLQTPTLGLVSWMDAKEGGQIRFNAIEDFKSHDGDFVDLLDRYTVETSGDYTISDQSVETSTASINVEVTGTASATSNTVTGVDAAEADASVKVSVCDMLENNFDAQCDTFIF